MEELMKQLSALGEGDVLFLAGSIPSSMADDAYQKIMEMLDSKGIRIVVDATRDLLMKVLPYHPFLIKPDVYKRQSSCLLRLSAHCRSCKPVRFRTSQARSAHLLC